MRPKGDVCQRESDAVNVILSGVEMGFLAVLVLPVDATNAYTAATILNELS